MIFHRVKGQKDILCPICNNISFYSEEFPGSYLICDKFRWEDDNVQDDDPDFSGGANDLSRNDYKRQWENYD